ncbi:MAG: YeeE/YedE family protein [Alphaproteobacteria bacterium]|jgi:uncharacterized protein|nr:YeeE/YedE family protein [Alphaproteobacteria bacterium]
MENFTPVSALIGGLMIGGAAVILMTFNGRIAGITGITRGVMRPVPGDVLWRATFLVAMILSPLLYDLVAPQPITVTVSSSVPLLLVGGFLVGFGACVSNGCTSGHGVCGIGRLSKRSFAATLTFMTTATITVYLTRHVFGVL